MLTAKFYDIQGFSVHDGPGIRLTCFMKGCPLRCAWCHSPESQRFPTELNYMEVKCVGHAACGRCIDACPNGAISRGEPKISPTGELKTPTYVDREKCTNCGACTETCYAKALFMCGTDWTVDDLMTRIIRERPFFESSDGGVTFSGGEVLCQPEFLLEILKRCRAEGIHTAVDTTGYAKWEVIEPILPYTNLFLYDLKNIDSELHRQATGVPNELILENAQKIASHGGKLMVRIPTMMGYNDSVEAFDKVGQFIKTLGDAVEVVQLLPYHKLGTVKWERLGRTAPEFHTDVPSDELMHARKEQLEAFGLNVIIH